MCRGRFTSRGRQGVDVGLDVGEEGGLDVLAGRHVGGHGAARGHRGSGVPREGGTGVPRHHPARLREMERLSPIPNHTYSELYK